MLKSKILNKMAKLKEGMVEVTIEKDIKKGDRLILAKGKYPVSKDTAKAYESKGWLKGSKKKKEE